MASVPRRASLLLLVPLAALWIACGEAPTTPTVIDVAPPAPTYDVAGADGDGTQGDVTLPSPGDNLISYGNIWPFHVVDYNAYDFVYVKVSGMITTSLGPCWAGGPVGTFGPWGHPNGSFQVRILKNSGRPLQVDNSTQGSSEMVAGEVPDKDGSVMVGRTGGGSTCLEYIDGDPIYTPGVIVSGSQNIHYEVYPVGELSAAPDWVVKRGATVLSVTSHWDITDPLWVYQPGDTLATARGPQWGKEACTGDLTCSYVPQQSGRVYLKGKIHGADVQIWGPIVWVRDFIPPECTLPPAGVAATPMKADGPYAGPPCPPDLPPEEEGDTLVVEMTLSAGEVTPVLDRQFDAAAQYWLDPNTPVRSDFVGVEVRARFSPSGRPAANGVVSLRADGLEGSGGHPHGPRPVGDLFLPSENVQTKSRVRDVLTVELDEEGNASAVFRTSGVSGEERIAANVTAEGLSGATEASVMVRWPGLSAMSRSDDTYFFSDQSHTRHGDINHWIEPAFGTRITAAFDDYFRSLPEPRFISGHTRFVITDASLEWGGLLDVGDQTWANPHKLHRTGEDMDIRYWSLNASQRSVFFDVCARYGLDCARHPNKEGADPSVPGDWHFHVRPGRRTP